MREYLFRGKRADNGEWVEGSLLTYSISEDGLEKEYDIKEQDAYNTSLKAYKVIPETVGQYTGLSDKNGVKIFEGDILENRYYPLGANPKAIKYYQISVVVYNGNGFGMQIKIDGTTILNTKLAESHHKNERETYKHPTAGENWIDKYFSGDLQILGNVHDNPELIK